MSKKKLQEYLSKIKKQNMHDHVFPKMDSFTFSINHKKLSKLFSGCKHPNKTLSFSIEPTYTLPRHRKNQKLHTPDEAERGEATLSDIERFLVENFKSLYGDKYEDDDQCNDFDTNDTNVEDEIGSSSDSKTKSQPLIMCLSEEDPTVPDECIVVMKRSSTPYDDFWRSMKEMIDARVENGDLADGEFLQEMLLCFLNLNEKKYYRYIVSAFMNLTSNLWHK